MECELFATHNHMPGSKNELRVWGTCMAPSPGYRLKLRPGNAGINPDPDQFVLHLIVEEPSEPGIEVVTQTEVEAYERKNADERKTVVVRGAEPSVVEIQHVH